MAEVVERRATPGTEVAEAAHSSSVEMISRIRFNLCLAKRRLRLEAKRERLLLPVVGHRGTFPRRALDTWSEDNAPMVRTRAAFSISLPPDMAVELERVMKEEHRSRSEVLREALRRYIESRLNGRVGR